MSANNSDALPQGSKLQDGRYTIGSTLGEGGFGITYRGLDNRLGRVVAIKEFYLSGCRRSGNILAFPSKYTLDLWQQKVTSFLDEAYTIARIKHPNIVSVFDCFSENDTAYMVMEFIEGVNLLTLCQQRGGKLPEAEALRYISDIGDALSELHAEGVLHRDVKPSNIMLNRRGRAVLIDFGAARDFVLDETITHTVIMSIEFAPPEQARRRAHRSPSSDIYSLAATCFYLLAGKPPDIDDDGVLADDAGIRPALLAALKHGMATRPTERPQTVADFMSEIQASLNPTIATPPEAPKPDAPPSAAIPIVETPTSKPIASIEEPKREDIPLPQPVVEQEEKPKREDIPSPITEAPTTGPVVEQREESQYEALYSHKIKANVFAKVYYKHEERQHEALYSRPSPQPTLPAKRDGKLAGTILGAAAALSLLTVLAFAILGGPGHSGAGTATATPAIAVPLTTPMPTNTTLAVLLTPTAMVAASTPTLTVALTLPAGTVLNDVHMVSSSEGWMVGTNGLILRYANGWQMVASPTNHILESIYLFSGGEGWAVGGSVDAAGNPTSSAIVQSQAGQWSEVASPTSNFLRGVYITTPSEGWAVGINGTILRYSGGQWAVASSPTHKALFGVCTISDDEGWAVGGDYSPDYSVILHYKAGQWTEVDSPAGEPLFNVQMLSIAEGWAVGAKGVILHYTAGGWTQIASHTTEYLFSLYMLSSGEGWAVGSNGAIIHFQDGEWHPVASPTNADLRSVYMVSANEGWAVGGDAKAAGSKGVILHYQNGGWARY